jgi:hypothetical protein
LRKESGGRNWIRTSEGVSQQIYSLPPLATWVSYLSLALERVSAGRKLWAGQRFYSAPGSKAGANLQQERLERKWKCVDSLPEEGLLFGELGAIAAEGGAPGEDGADFFVEFFV